MLQQTQFSCNWDISPKIFKIMNDSLCRLFHGSEHLAYIIFTRYTSSHFDETWKTITRHNFVFCFFFGCFFVLIRTKQLILF